MKKRVIFCLFLSIYLVYSNGNKFYKDIFSTEKMAEILRGNFGIKTFRSETDNSPDSETRCKQNNIFEKTVETYSKDQTSKNFTPIVKNNTRSDINYDSLPIYQKKVLEAGYDFEYHKIHTEDGYILTSWRLLKKRQSSNNKSYSNKTNTQTDNLLIKPIILQHGLFDTSYTWLMLNASESLPIKLLELGYDVWLTNSRGNIFSLEHTNPEFDSNSFYSKFWDFSLHEMAQFDFPANIFYIKNLTGASKVDYIGHSQGTVQYFIQYTLNPAFIEENVDNFVSIGTVVNIFNTTSTIVQFLENTYLMKAIEQVYFKNLLNMQPIIHDLIGYACRYLHFICENIVRFFIEDYYTGRIDYPKLFENFFHVPGGTSTRNVNHWVQFYETKLFTQFDYGKEINFVKYGKSTPPKYDLAEFKNYKVRSLMTLSNADPFSKPEDCQHLFDYLDKDVFTVLNLDGYNHMDYLWSRDSGYLYTEISNFLQGGK